MTRLSIRNAPKYSFGGVPEVNEPEVSTYVSNVVAAGGSVSSSNKALLNTLIRDLRANGTLGTIQRWYFPAGSDSFAGGMVPLIDTLSLGNFTNNGFTSTQWSTAGLKGSGSQYIRSGYTPSTHIVSPDSFSITAEVTDWVVDASYPTLWGTTDGVNRLTLFASNTPDVGSELYDQSTTSVYTATALGVGTICANRSSSTSHILDFNNTTLVGNTTLRTVSPPAIELYLHAMNRNGSPDNHSSSRILSTIIAASQTGTQRTTLITAMSAYKTAKGI